MRAPYVHVDAPLTPADSGASIEFSAAQQHHLTTVLRRGDGDGVVVSDGLGRSADVVLRRGAAPDRVRGDLVGPVVVHPPHAPSVVVVHALPKGRGLDEVVRTLAELGVVRIDPVVTARTASRPPTHRAARAAERWQGIARSAVEQARSPFRCDVGTPRPLLGAAEQLAEDERGIVAVPGAGTTLGGALADADGKAVRLVVGPEGGLTTEEVAALQRSGWIAARAGATVIRSVHAATVLVAATMALTGRYS